MIELTDALEQMRGEYVDIYTKHRFFGSQHIQMKFDPETQKGFGFHCKGQSIYIGDNEVVGYNIENSKVIVKGKDMTIEIVQGA